MSTHSAWRTLGSVVALAAAVGLGFFIARQTAPTAPPPVAATAPAPAQTGELKLNDAYIAAAGIVAEKVEAGNLSTDVLAPATVNASPSGVAVVTAHAAGTIVRLGHQLGDPIQTGETLAVVESREAAAMAAERSVAESKAALARSAMAREQELYGQRVTPRQDLERAQAEVDVAEAEVRRARAAAEAAHLTPDGRIAVISPLSGRITSATAALGTFVQPETELFRITDPNFIQIEAAVTVMDAPRIVVGDMARVATPSGEVLQARVRSITPTVNEQTRAATVVLSLLGRPQSLSPGEIVQVAITPKNTAETGVIIPEEALQNVDGRNVVFVRIPGGFKVRSVVTGARTGGRISIVSGLNAGEAVATTNAFLLKAELSKGAEEE